MDKRGASVSIFIIVALAIALTGIFYYATNDSSLRDLFAGSLRQKITLETEYNSLQTHVQSCLSEKTQKGIEEYGLKWTSEDKIESLILSEITDCIDFPYFEEKGVRIARGMPEVDVRITEDALISSLNYSITMTLRNETASLRKFEYNLKLEKTLSLTSTPYSGTELRAITEDTYAELIVPYGTRAAGIEGESLGETISIKILDRNFDAHNNGIIVGTTVYDLKPDGAVFSSPLTLKIKYNQNKLPEGSKEENLRIVWYDEVADIWRAVPTQVDTRNKILTAEIYHFTIYGVGDGCAGKDPTEGLINEINIQQMSFIQLCGTLEEEGSGTCQKVTDGPGWSDTGEIKGLEEKAYNDKVPVVQEPNPTTPPGQIPHTLEISLLDWDGDDLEIESLSQVTIRGDTVCASDTFKQACIDDCSAKAKESFGEIEERFFSSDSLKDGKQIFCDSVFSTQSSGRKVCESVSCSQDTLSTAIATIMTYGYKDEGQAATADKTLAGGWGVLFFTATKDGDTCVAESGEQSDDLLELTKLRVTLVDSSEEQASGEYPYLVCADPQEEGAESCDNFITEDDTQVVKQVLYNPTKEIENKEVKGLAEDPEKDYGLRSGQNAVYFRVENLDEKDPNGCIWAEMGMTVWGVGINQSQLDMELDTGSEYLQSSGYGYTYGGLNSEGWSSCVEPWGVSSFASLGASCAEFGADPESGSDSQYCTEWELSLATEQVVALIAETASQKWDAIDKNIKTELEKSGMDSTKFQKLIIGIAMQESSLSHCAASGKVKTGDGGSSIGLMQIPNSKPAYRLVSNIEIGIDHLIGKFTMVDCRAGHTLDCSATCDRLKPSGISCASEQKTYSGWQCALRGYNGWGCRYTGSDGNHVYCGPDCNSYVERISGYMDQIGEIPKCTGTSSSTGGGASASSCTITTTSASGVTSTSAYSSSPLSTGISIPAGSYGSIVATAKQYLGCNYVYNPVRDTNIANCRQPGKGFTCATFVSTVVSQACGVSISGHGSMICENSGVVPLGNNPSVLKPGDLFSWGRWDGVGEFGHTGIYVGTNSNGEHVFIDAWTPSTGVRYATLSQLGNHPDMRFCRVNSCG